MNNDAAVLAALLRRDLNSFIMKVFGTVDGRPFLPNWHIELLADRLTRVYRGEIKRLIICLPPRNLKSLAASVAFPAWVLGHNAAARIVCASYGNDLSSKLARDCRKVMSAPWYLRTFDTRLDPDKSAAAEFETTKGGYRLSTSVGGTLTGRGASIIIIDDPIKPPEALSDVRRDGVNEWFDSTVLSRLDNKRNDAIVIVMQRVHVDDLVAHVQEKGRWEVLSLPAIADVNETFTLLDGRTVGRKIGALLHPEREPMATLNEWRAGMGTFNFNTQYLQKPVPAAGNMIKRKWFRYYDVPPTWTQGDRIIQSWDVAITSGDRSDWSVCTTWLQRKKDFYLLDVFRKRLAFPDLKRAVVQQAEKYHRPFVLIEEVSIGTGLIQQLKAEGKVYVIGIRPEGSKADRMSANSPVIEAGSLLLPRSAPWLDVYLSELLAFPSSKNDDQVDSTSQALSWGNPSRPRAGVLSKGIYRY